jgi:hypothetical protein
MQILATEQIGPTQSMTPEGFLLCEAVPIARTGTQLYAGYELPWLEDGLDGLITVVREDADVFRPETIASFEGKSVTIKHTFVDPDNVRDVEVGHAQNVRRSETEPDLLIADLLIKDARAIEMVRVQFDESGRRIEPKMREISCGYNADYEQDRPGIAYQRCIIGNHVALVERGRAGPRCSIQDEEVDMTTKTKGLPDLLKRLLTAARTGDTALLKRTADAAEEELEAEEKKAADEEAAEERKQTADALADLKKTVDTLASVVQQLVKTKDEEADPEPKKTGDEEDPEPKTEDDEPTAEEKKQTADAMRDTASRAEILVPGYTMPTADSVAGLCDVAVVRQKVLIEAFKTADGKAIIEPLLAGRKLGELTADDSGTVFVAASELMRAKNNSRGIVRSVATKDFGKAPISNSEINKRNTEFWKNH